MRSLGRLGLTDCFIRTNDIKDTVKASSPHSVNMSLLYLLSMSHIETVKNTLSDELKGELEALHPGLDSCPSSALTLVG